MTYCDAWETCIVPLRVVGLLVLSNTAGFSFLIRLCVARDVPTGESDLVTLCCGRSQRALSMTSPSTVCLLTWC